MGKGSFDFLSGIFYITLIEPCFNSNGVVAGIKRIVIIINDNEDVYKRQVRKYSGYMDDRKLYIKFI